MQVTVHIAASARRNEILNTVSLNLVCLLLQEKANSVIRQGRFSVSSKCSSNICIELYKKLSLLLNGKVYFENAINM